MGGQRCYENELVVPKIEGEPSRHQARVIAGAAIASAIAALEANTVASSESDRHDSVYTGGSGIALLYLRIYRRHPSIFRDYDVRQLITKHLPQTLHRHSPAPGRLSPIGSTTGPAIVEILSHLLLSTSDPVRLEKATATLENALRHACAADEDGIDEVLYGRAGFLWGVLALREHLRTKDTSNLHDFTAELCDTLSVMLSDKVIAKLVEMIVRAGRRGGRENGNSPLMWSWHGKEYLGAIHGAAGILTVLFQCPVETVGPYLEEMIRATDYLCSLLDEGHLPSSLPARRREHPYVQICHGSPGLLILLGTIKHLHPALYTEAYASKLEGAIEAVWGGALVTKGLGICHGVPGNAWALMLVGKAERALALMLEARDMPPLQDVTGYRLPDRPWSLFEGVAGTVAAWCDLMAILQGETARLIGFPGIGGRGLTGLI